MNVGNDKVWTPKEIKQKDIIYFHMPYIRRPVTSRMLRYFMPSFIISIAIFFIFSRFKAILFQLSVFCILFPFAVVVILNSPKEGLYLEDIAKNKFKYKSKASVLLNEKALKARNRRFK